MLYIVLYLQAEWKESYVDLGVQLGYPKFLAEHIELLKSKISTLGI